MAQRLRADADLVECEDAARSALQDVTGVTITLKAQQNPACVAEIVLRVCF